MTKALMIQGTMSNVGKSLVTAGLCRIFKQDGYKVAPFKAQNMAMNSYITKEGLEMATAQAVQAEAAGIDPNVLMNPILLKPSDANGSQVIVNGKVLGNMEASEYAQNKAKLLAQVMNAYNTLTRQYEIVVIEGAGSPAEINLNDLDLVNMGMAKRAQAPVLLVADIDRGGVFASIYGTIMLLPEEERRMIKGTIINKFRGSADSLQSGLQAIAAKTGVPVLGVIPYLQVDIEDEDCLAERERVYRNAVTDGRQQAKQTKRATGAMTCQEYQEYKERQYDLLAAEIRKNVDLKAIYSILEAGV